MWSNAEGSIIGQKTDQMRLPLSISDYVCVFKITTDYDCKMVG